MSGVCAIAGLLQECMKIKNLCLGSKLICDTKFAWLTYHNMKKEFNTTKFLLSSPAQTIHFWLLYMLHEVQM
jgi:hypothetical protein